MTSSGRTDGAAIAEVAEVVERVVRARVRDRDSADDAVQEALLRIASAPRRLEGDDLKAYAIVTAQNVVTSRSRRWHRERRRVPLLVEREGPTDPADDVVREEERSALQAAVGRLEPVDRELLVAQVNGATTAELGEALGTSAGAVAMRLARARSRLRLEYLLVFRRLEPPGPECRKVLLAVSDADRRRQLALGADEHLRQCRFCADLTDALTSRHRPVAAWLAPLGVAEALRRVARGRPAQITAFASVAAAVAVTAAVVVPRGGESATPPPATTVATTPAPVATTTPAPAAATTTATATTLPPPTVAPPPSAPLVSGTTGLLPLPADGLGRYVGQPVTGRAVPVLDVVADEGVWIGDPTSRIWVRLTGQGESPIDVVAGQLLDLDGVVAAATADPGILGSADPDVAAAVALAGGYLVIDYGHLAPSG